MKRFAPVLSLLMWAALASVLSLAMTVAGPAPKVALLVIEGPIGPATSDYFVRAHQKALDAGADLVVVRIDTPGGLDSSMRDITKTILASAVPVVSYVSPGGARAASAGTFLLYASHIAAMAPTTNLGAATPVRVGGIPGPPAGGQPAAPETDEKNEKKSDEKKTSKSKESPVPPPASASERKAINDAVAFIRGLAERRGRNADWAERAVREGVSLPSHEALKMNVIDLMATDLDDLLSKIDGRKVQTAIGTTVINTKGAVVERFEPDWRSRFLSVITSPTIAVILMLIGIYGLLLEGYSPGAIIPGVVGAICLLLGLFALQALPVNYVGFGLIALGVALMIAEGLAPSFGALGFGGITAFVFGAILLIDTDVPGFGVNRGVIAGIALAAAGTMMVTLYLVQRARRVPAAPSDVVPPGSLAEVVQFTNGRGWAKLAGEHWLIASTADLHPGQTVIVRSAKGLTLIVEPAPAAVPQPAPGSGA